MTARNHAMANRVADALLANLRQIGMTNGPWLTAPKWVERGMSADFLNLPKPALFVKTMGWGPNTMLGKPSAAHMLSRVDASFSVLCICDQPVTKRESEQELNNLASDVINAVVRDFQLRGLGLSGTALLESGFLSVSGYRPEMELSSNLMSAASVDINATWLWDTQSP